MARSMAEPSEPCFIGVVRFGRLILSAACSCSENDVEAEAQIVGRPWEEEDKTNAPRATVVGALKV